MKTKNILGLNDPFHRHHPHCNIGEDYKKFGYINEYERKHIQLLEFYHVGYFEYREMIEIIISYILDEVYPMFETSKPYITLDLNNIKTSTGKVIKIPFTDVFTIHIYPTNNNVYAEYIPKGLKIEYGIVKSIEMIIKVPVIQEPYVEYTLRRLLYHEFLHCKEDIERTLKNNSNVEEIYMSDKSMVDYKKVTTILQSDLISENDDRRIIANILYRLFVSTEKRALINELYVDLINLKKLGIVLTTENIKEMLLKETETGKTYVYFRDDILPECKKDKQFVKLSHIFFNKSFLSTFKTDNKFYKWFINYFESQLQSLFVNMCKVSEMFILNEFNIPNKEINKFKRIKDVTDKIVNMINEELILPTGSNIMYNTYIIPYTIKDKLYESVVSVEKMKFEYI